MPLASSASFVRPRSIRHLSEGCWRPEYSTHIFVEIRTLLIEGLFGFLDFAKQRLGKRKNRMSKISAGISGRVKRTGNKLPPRVVPLLSDSGGSPLPQP
jgi:hypothetical protein